MSQLEPDRSSRISTLELFFDLVFTPWLTSTEGFVIAPEHFVERHALVVIVAAVAALATIPLATQLDAKAQVGALAAIVAVALAVEGARSRQISV